MRPRVRRDRGRTSDPLQSQQTRTQHRSPQNQRKLRQLKRTPPDSLFAKKVDIIRKGADFNATEPSSERSALMIACAAGNLDLAKGLLDGGANLALLDVAGNTAFSLALTSEKGPNIGLIGLLLENGADPLAGKFVWKGDDHEEVEKSRRRTGKNGRVVSGSGRPAPQSYSSLHIRRNIYFKSSQKHIDRSSKIPVKSRIFENDATAAAIRRGFEGIAVRLLKRLSSWNKKCSESGWGYLHLACLYRNWDVAKLLLEHGAMASDKGYGGKDVWACCTDEDAVHRLGQLQDSGRQDEQRARPRPCNKANIENLGSTRDFLSHKRSSENHQYSKVQQANAGFSHKHINLKNVSKHRPGLGTLHKTQKYCSPLVKSEIQALKISPKIVSPSQIPSQISKKHKKNNRKKRKKQKRKEALKRAQKLKQLKLVEKSVTEKSSVKPKLKAQNKAQNNVKVEIRSQLSYLNT